MTYRRVVLWSVGGVTVAVVAAVLLVLALVRSERFSVWLLGTLESARHVGERIVYFGGDLSPMLVAVGFIVRLNVAVLIFIGLGSYSTATSFIGISSQDSLFF